MIALAATCRSKFESEKKKKKKKKMPIMHVQFYAYTNMMLVKYFVIFCMVSVNTFTKYYFSLFYFFMCKRHGCLNGT